jgi:uncharacterized phiE125 gp8 family phage protein
MNLARTTPPALFPVTLSEAKMHLRVDHIDEDALVQGLIAAAVSELDGPEGYLGRCIMSQTWTMSLTDWGTSVTIPLRPVVSVTVAYDDEDNAPQTLASGSYRLVTNWCEPARIEWIGTLPTLGEAFYPVRIAVTCGAAEAPADLKAALLLRVCDLYTNRAANGADVKPHPAYRHLVNRLRVMQV